MEQSGIKIIKKTFQAINDMVVPTMGAKGRMAVLNDEFSRPILTDDGVTVARQALKSVGFPRMVALSMVEAANATEKTAFDGTTLTILLVNELYKTGLSWVKRGMHPQKAADLLIQEVSAVRNSLFKGKDHLKLSDDQVYNLALITTKIPLVAQLVTEAYEKSDGTMNVLTDMDRVKQTSSVEHVPGMLINSGYFSETLKERCNVGDQTVFENAYVVLLAEGILTPQDIRQLFQSIPSDALKKPFVFIISKDFNPEALRILIDTLVGNNMLYQFVFINDQAQEELFLDIAAFTKGDVQDVTMGSSLYLFKNMGFADKITIEKDKTWIIHEGAQGFDAVKRRIFSYEEELKKEAFTTSYLRNSVITSRLMGLRAGATTIKVAAPTVTEYTTIRLKIDDAVGALRCAGKTGILIGGGKALYNLGEKHKALRKPLQEPMKRIIKNAGLRLVGGAKALGWMGVDVRTGGLVNLYEAGIVDSFDSVDRSLQNAVSIAANYLRVYTLIKAD